MFWLGVFLGVFVGVFLGLCLGGLLAAARRGDDLITAALAQKTAMIPDPEGRNQPVP